MEGYPLGLTEPKKAEKSKYDLNVQHWYVTSLTKQKDKTVVIVTILILNFL